MDVKPPMDADERRWNEDASNDARVADTAACERLARLCRMTQEMLDRMTDAQRDRMLQEHLAAARGPEKNLKCLCDMTQALLELRLARKTEDQKGGGDGL